MLLLVIVSYYFHCVNFNIEPKIYHLFSFVLLCDILCDPLWLISFFNTKELKGFPKGSQSQTLSKSGIHDQSQPNQIE